MPDLFDRAQSRANQNTTEALLRYRNHLQPEPPQQIVAGVVLCIDCDEAIPAARLAAKPNAARCAQCQSIHEGLHRGA